MATWFKRLDSSEVVAMRQLAAQGVTQRELMSMFSVSLATVCRTVNGRTHPDLPVLPHRKKPLRKGGLKYGRRTYKTVEQATLDTLRNQLASAKA